MSAHQKLLTDIASFTPKRGTAAFWWIGQMGFIIKAGSRVLYLDPFLQERETRLVPPLLSPDEVTHADLVLATHAHSDHIDKVALPVIMSASPQCRFVSSRVARKNLLDLGIPTERTIALDEGLVHEEEDLRIEAIAAQHEFFDRDESLGYPYLCYIIQTGGVTLFHAGDTLRYDGMAARLSRWKFDAAFLPINGRDAERLARRCLGNMTYQEAVDLAGDLRPGLTVPGHFDMFANNSEDPSLFTAYMDVKFPQLRYWTGEHGTRVEFGPGAVS